MDDLTITVPDPATAGRTCYLCGGQTFTRLHAWAAGERRNSATIPVAVWRCACGLVLLHPVPMAGQLPDQGDWWSTNRAALTRHPGFKRLRRKVRAAFINTAQHRLIRATRRAVPAGRLLDVGCGTGTLLKEAAPFYTCVGLDPSARALDAARAAGFEVILGNIETVPLPRAAFDVVTLYSVIEHLADPGQTLRIVWQTLRPGGVVVLQTPKMGGPAYRRHGKEWNGFRVGYHTFLFDGRTLGRTLESAGFEVLRSPKRDRMLDDNLILWGRKPGP